MGQIKYLKMDQAAWKEGFRAGEEGKASCPYPAHSREAWSWQSGFVEGIACSVQKLAPQVENVDREIPKLWEFDVLVDPDEIPKAEEPISGRVPDNEVPKAAVRQVRAALVGVRTRLLKSAGELSKPMEERLKNCPAGDVNESLVDGLSIEEQTAIGPLLRSVAELNKQIDRIEEIEGDEP
jgi:hypothetical protein